MMDFVLKMMNSGAGHAGAAQVAAERMDFLLNNHDFRVNNHDFLLKNDDCLLKMMISLHKQVADWRPCAYADWRQAPAAQE